MNTRSKPDDAKTEASSKRPHWTLMLASLTVPIASFAAAYLANRFQEQNTAITILNQREQSESNLRASMFRELINPIIGQQRNNQDIDPDRYRLLAELLLLNFHEHFEFKSLLIDVDRKLQDAGKDPKLRQVRRFEEARRSLRSAARRVIDRQIAMLGDGNDTGCTAGGRDGAPPAMVEFELTNLVKAPPGKTGAADAGSAARRQKAASLARVQVALMGNEGKQFTEPQIATSPDCRDKFVFAFENPDWTNGMIKIHVDADRGGDLPEFITEFTLTQFDFPFTDNTLLADGNRFAVIIHSVNPESRTMWLRLVWFPKDYFPPRERPTDFQRFKQAVPLLNRGAARNT